MEMTSMLDVMFLVLVFFIYCIFDMTVHKGVKVDLPDAPGAKETGERIVVTIRADDTLELNGIVLPRGEIVRRIGELNAADVKMPVIISGDRRSSLASGVEILSLMKNAGVEKVSFQVSGKK
jgi:biopolymer transport protein ExbD